MIETTIEPIFNENSQILILGSFPSVNSLKAKEFYATKTNRFWRVIAGVLGCPVPLNYEEKRKMLLENGIALSDVVVKCDREGSLDSAIKNEVPSNAIIENIVRKSKIKRIVLNGRKAQETFYKSFPNGAFGCEILCMPSTSSANAAYSFDRLLECWKPFNKPIIE